MEYDGIIEYFDTSLVESGTEQESRTRILFFMTVPNL